MTKQRDHALPSTPSATVLTTSGTEQPSERQAKRHGDLREGRRPRDGRLGKIASAHLDARRLLAAGRVLVREVTATTVKGSAYIDGAPHAVLWRLAEGWTCSCRPSPPCGGIAALQRLTAPLEGFPPPSDRRPRLPVQRPGIAD